MVCKVAQAACMAAVYKVVTRERLRSICPQFFYEKEKLFKIELKESYIYIYYNFYRSVVILKEKSSV